MSDDRGDLDLTKQIEVLTQKVKELEKENGDLRTSIGHRIERVEELNAINREHQSEIEILKKEIGRFNNT
jgi:chromosome segregation ATPase|tara:strand:+ start:99 stop:308 length:210 start_codon:yes stop_codon:yes gene_type:complete